MHDTFLYGKHGAKWDSISWIIMVIKVKQCHYSMRWHPRDMGVFLWHSSYFAALNDVLHAHFGPKAHWWKIIIHFGKYYWHQSETMWLLHGIMCTWCGVGFIEFCSFWCVEWHLEWLLWYWSMWRKGAFHFVEQLDHQVEMIALFYEMMTMWCGMNFIVFCALWRIKWGTLCMILLFELWRKIIRAAYDHVIAAWHVVEVKCNFL